MSHFPKPFFRPKKNRWYVQLDGKHVNLGPEREAAFRRYHEVLAERKQPISRVFLRMKKHLEKKYALVDFRHSFTTRALKEGVDPVTLAFLLGHPDTSMLAKTYAHLGQEIDHTPSRDSRRVPPSSKRQQECVNKTLAFRGEDRTMVV